MQSKLLDGGETVVLFYAQLGTTAQPSTAGLPQAHRRQVLILASSAATFSSQRAQIELWHVGSWVYLCPSKSSARVGHLSNLVLGGKRRLKSPFCCSLHESRNQREQVSTAQLGQMSCSAGSQKGKRQTSHSVTESLDLFSKWHYINLGDTKNVSVVPSFSRSAVLAWWTHSKVVMQHVSFWAKIPDTAHHQVVPSSIILKLISY